MSMKNKKIYWILLKSCLDDNAKEPPPNESVINLLLELSILNYSCSLTIKA